MSDGNQELAEALVRLVIRHLKERLGYGPYGYQTYLLDDMIVIRLFRALTLAEYEMGKTDGGRRSVADARGSLIAEVRPSLEDVIKKSTGADVISIYSDLSTRTGEQIVILVLDRKVRELPGGSNGGE
jgi:uncharacterized protein YbcI